MQVQLFCVIGCHTGPLAETDGVRVEIHPQWRVVKARFDEKKKEWRYDPTSPAGICVCPFHSVKGEITLN